MRVGNVFSGGSPVFSFEFFPPKSEPGEASLFRAIDQLRELRPTFVSVTYGAGGSTRDKTVELVCHIKHELQIEAVAHLTCVGAGRDEIRRELARLRAGGIENVLALRGDPPRDRPFETAPNGFAFASELVRFIRAEGFDFSVGGACYPEGHVEAPDLDTDLRHLRAKVNAGVDFLVTQLFFDCAHYFSFVDRARAGGIAVPILPGIMPITNTAQIDRFTKMCGASIPGELRRRLTDAGEDESAVRALGIEHATAQCRELLARGAPGIHFYTLNQSPATRAILTELRR